MKREIADKIFRLQSEVRMLRRELSTARQRPNVVLEQQQQPRFEANNQNEPTTTTTKTVRGKAVKMKIRGRGRNKKKADGKELKRKEGLLQIQGLTYSSDSGLHCSCSNTSVDSTNDCNNSLREAVEKIEFLEQQLFRMKNYYERQVASIKCSAQMLECQMHKMQNTLQEHIQNQNNAFTVCDNYYQDIITAVDNLEKRGEQMFDLPTSSMEQLLSGDTKKLLTRTTTTTRIAGHASQCSLHQYSSRDMDSHASSSIGYIMNNCC